MWENVEKKIDQKCAMEKNTQINLHEQLLMIIAREKKSANWLFVHLFLCCPCLRRSFLGARENNLTYEYDRIDRQDCMQTRRSKAPHSLLFHHNHRRKKSQERRKKLDEKDLRCLKEFLPLSISTVRLRVTTTNSSKRQHKNGVYD